MTLKGVCQFLLDDVKITKKKKSAFGDEWSSDPYECLSTHKHYYIFLLTF